MMLDDTQRYEYIEKIVTYRHKEYPEIYATRSRDTDGTCKIKLNVKGKSFVISNENADIGDHYELVCRAVIEVLEKACDDSCMIQKVIS